MRNYKRLWSIICINDDGQSNTLPSYASRERCISEAVGDIYDDLAEGHRDAQRELRETGRHAAGGLTFILQTSEIHGEEVEQLQQARDIYGIGRPPWALESNQADLIQK